MKRLFTLVALLIAGFSANLPAQMNIELTGHLSYSEDLSDIWGYEDQQGNEYALVGVYSGLSVVSLADPAFPQEIFFGSGAQSIWRDIKTWGDYAYVSNESYGGIYIVDLSPLPEGPIVTTGQFTGDQFPFQSAHNLYIDETGKLYIFGADNGSGGAIICDLTVDPMSPVELGRFDVHYLHDGMARGDTLWGAAIYAGQLLAIDVSNPAQPNIMGSASTPGNFCHNAWVSGDGNYVFTTDEVSSGYIGAFDVTNLSSITEVDRVQTAPGSGVIPHNTHVLGDFVVTSYYTEGVTIHDVSKPDNIIEVGHYDTSPGYSGSGYHGSWGAYPFLSSGLILASDIEEGLYVLTPQYLKAVHVSGTVTDSTTGDPLFGVSYEVVDAGISGQTLFDGTFTFGTLTTGTFDIVFTHEGYDPYTVHNLDFTNGAIIDLDIKMQTPSITGIGFSEESSVRMAPNPFSETVRIFAENGAETDEVSVKVFNITGTVIDEWSGSLSAAGLRLGSDWETGIYLIQVSDLTEGKSTIRRLVKQR
ncbi:MAG: hypothetical protein Kow00127_12010 [Bacteroidales bacterium]